MRESASCRPSYGVVGNLLVGHLFYQRSGRELQQEAKRLRFMITILGRALENAGVIEATWTPNGELAGAVIHLSGSAGGRGTATGTLTVNPGPNQ